MATGYGPAPGHGSPPPPSLPGGRRVQVRIAPMPLISTRSRGSSCQACRRQVRQLSVSWITPGRPWDSIREAVLHSGRAVTMTTVLLCIGFGLNAVSSFPSMQILGILGAVVIGVALLGDLFLLPALLVLAGPKSTPSEDPA